MMLTGGLMMLWATLLFIGLPLAVLGVAVALLLRSPGRMTRDAKGDKDEGSR